MVLVSDTGIYGFLTFGAAVKPDILMSYNGDDMLMVIARLLFGISILTIYPIILLLGRWVGLDTRGYLGLKRGLPSGRERRVVVGGPADDALRCRSVMQDPILRWWAGRDGSVPETVEVRSRCVLSFLWIALTLLIAMFVPDISKIISVIGGVSAAFIFIFPGKRSAAEQVAM